MANGKIGLSCAAIATIFGCILAMHPSGFEDGATESVPQEQRSCQTGTQKEMRTIYKTFCRRAF